MGSACCSQCRLFKCTGSVPTLGVNPSSADDLLCGLGNSLNSSETPLCIYQMGMLIVIFIGMLRGL